MDGNLQKENICSTKQSGNEWIGTSGQNVTQPQISRITGKTAVPGSVEDLLSGA